MAYRICDHCGERFTAGYCVEQGQSYYCSDACLHEHIKPEEWAELYADGDGDSYYSDWSEAEDDEMSNVETLPTALNVRQSVTDYDGIEVQPAHWDGEVWEGDTGGNVGPHSVVGVYLHVAPDSPRAKHSGGGVEHFADFPTFSLAKTVADELGRLYDLPVRYFVGDLPPYAR